MFLCPIPRIYAPTKKTQSDHLVWTPAITFKLIETVKKDCAELCDREHPLNRDRKYRFIKYGYLADIFHTTPSEIRRKLHNLRTQYHKELKKPYSTWEYFEALSYMKPEPGSSNEGLNRKDGRNLKTNAEVKEKINIEEAMTIEDTDMPQEENCLAQGSGQTFEASASHSVIDSDWYLETSRDVISLSDESSSDTISNVDKDQTESITSDLPFHTVVRPAQPERDPLEESPRKIPHSSTASKQDARVQISFSENTTESSEEMLARHRHILKRKYDKIAKNPKRYAKPKQLPKKKQEQGNKPVTNLNNQLMLRKTMKQARKHDSPTSEEKHTQTDLSLINNDLFNTEEIPQTSEQIFGEFVASELCTLRSKESQRKLKFAIQKAIMQAIEEDADLVSENFDN